MIRASAGGSGPCGCVHRSRPAREHPHPDQTVEGECVSVLSENGMSARPLNPYPRNDHLAIEMNINGRVVFADAAVLHSHQPGKEPFTEPGMGLKFIRIAPEDRDFLRQFIREEDSRGIVPENE